MACPICDQKPANCDCTETEKRQWSEIEDLRLTDEERAAIERAIDTLNAVQDIAPSATAADAMAAWRLGQMLKRLA